MPWQVVHVKRVCGKMPVPAQKAQLTTGLTKRWVPRPLQT